MATAQQTLGVGEAAQMPLGDLPFSATSLTGVCPLTLQKWLQLPEERDVWI